MTRKRGVALACLAMGTIAVGAWGVGASTGPKQTPDPALTAAKKSDVSRPARVGTPITPGNQVDVAGLTDLRVVVGDLVRAYYASSGTVGVPDEMLAARAGTAIDQARAWRANNTGSPDADRFAALFEEIAVATVRFAVRPTASTRAEVTRALARHRAATGAQGS